MNRPPRKRVRVLLRCRGDDLRDEREHLVEVGLPRLRHLLARRDIDADIDLGPSEDHDGDRTGLVEELDGLAAPGTIVLCVIGSSYGRPIEELPVEVGHRFPHLIPYEGCSRLELVVRHALASADVKAPIFVLRTVAEPEPATAALRRVILKSGARIVADDTPPSELAELGREIVAAVWQAILEREGELPQAEAPDAVYLDENVQFTVYRPRAVRPAEWYELLAFAHLAERRPEALEHELDPLAQVRAQAARLLGPRLADYDDPRSDSRQGIPRDGTITFLPEVPGVEFNPERRVFRWQEDVHREEFRLRAHPGLTGQTARGRMSVYLGAIIVAELDLAFRIDETAQSSAIPDVALSAPEHARPYRRIFASYSHRDAEIVRQFELLATSLGDEYLRDVVRLRSGDDWDAELRRLIDHADIFQLFWSTNSMRSPEVRREWEYALSLGRTQFVRPTYWEDPLPTVREPELPPESLRRLHFHRIVDLPVGEPQPSAPALRPAPPLGQASPADNPPPAPSKSGFRVRTLLIPLAVIVVAGVSFTSFFALQRPPNSSSEGPPGATQPAPQPTQSQPSSGGPSATGSAPPPVARLYSMEVIGARRVLGPRRSRPQLQPGDQVSTVYATVSGQRLQLNVDFVNPQATAASVVVRTGLVCLSASGQNINVDGEQQIVSVTADPNALPGQDPVSSWTSSDLVVPAACRASSSKTDLDGLVWVESATASASAKTRISAGFTLS